MSKLGEVYTFMTQEQQRRMLFGTSAAFQTGYDARLAALGEAIKMENGGKDPSDVHFELGPDSTRIFDNLKAYVRTK